MLGTDTQCNAERRPACICQAFYVDLEKRPTHSEPRREYSTGVVHTAVSHPERSLK